jgi:riboflavin biosynthesis pyrimidine reductase
VLGSTAKSWGVGELTKTIGDAKFWTLRTVRALGNDVCMEYEVVPAKL